MGGLRYHDKLSLNFCVEKGSGESFFDSMEKLNNFIKAEWVRQGNKLEFYERIGPRVLVILDNASYHKREARGTEDSAPQTSRQDIPIENSAITTKYTALFFTSDFSPDLNLIELVWHSCKARPWEYPPSRLYVKSSLLIGYLSRSTNFKKF